jgi:REP element-mobilizing transposase RayT
MQLSDFGKIIEHEWIKSFEIRKELFLHQYVIMPNHIHTIVEIYHENRDDLYGKTQCLNIDIETNGRVSLPPNVTPNATNSDTSIELIDPQLLSIKRNPPKRLPKSISSFIAGFKSAVNTKIDGFIDEHQLGIPKYNRKNHYFQPNYHDHIVRNDWEYLNIANYIINNPNNWHRDKLNSRM